MKFLLIQADMYRERSACWSSVLWVSNWDISPWSILHGLWFSRWLRLPVNIRRLDGNGI